MNNRFAVKVIVVFSLLAVIFLLLLIYGIEGPEARQSWAFLPLANAILNGISATAVVCGLWNIYRNNKRAHALCMIAAFFASALFLVGYIAHHALHGDTPFVARGWIRPVYFTILISHILLSIVALPLVLISLFFAASKQWSTHRIVARLTYPVWLYVSLTGVLIFLFLRFWNFP